MTGRTLRRTMARGFTLVEMVMVIVITGIIAGIVAVFIRSPVDAYLDAARRAELTDIADTAVRRLGRDIRLALPNSLRHPADGSDQCIELIPTRIGGRYRAEVDASGGGDVLDFTASAAPFDAGFDMLWPNTELPTDTRIRSGDIVVVFNDSTLDASTTNAYWGGNAIKVQSVDNTQPATTPIAFVDAATGSPFNRKQLPVASPTHRFQVVPADEHVVAYVCSGIGTANGTGTGSLFRYARTLTAAYPRPAGCPAPPSGTPVLATRLSQCSLKYEGATGVPMPGMLATNGIVSMTLTVSENGESVRLYHQANVNNQP